MAGALKQSFLEAVRTTPEGISAFLETPLPEAPTIATPADVDAATIACGVLSKYLLDVFASFNGLTPVELLLRIGQHNSVLESAMLAGLEYIEGGDPAERDVAFTEPAAGQSYMPGEMRFVVTVKNGVPDRVEIVVDDNSPYNMASEDGQTWTYYQEIADVGEHSAQASALFATETQTASVSFTIEDYDPEFPPEPPPEIPPAPPGGKDVEALKRARENVLSTYKNLIKAAAETNEIDLVIYFNAFKSAVTSFLAVAQQTSNTIQADLTRLTLAVAAFNYNDVKTISSAIMNAINSIYTKLVG